MEVFFVAENRLLTDYIYYMAKRDDHKDKTALYLPSTSWFGSLLIASCRISQKPIRRPDGDNVICIRLPINDATQYLENHFIFISKADMARLNAALKSIFEIDLYTYYLKAKDLGIRKKDALEAFIISRGLNSVDRFDAMTKRIYRRETSALSNTTKILLRKINYINESINLDGIDEKNR